jgi:hypothetical protein
MDKAKDFRHPEMMTFFDDLDNIPIYLEVTRGLSQGRIYNPYFYKFQNLKNQNNGAKKEDGKKDEI